MGGNTKMGSQDAFSVVPYFGMTAYGVHAVLTG